MDIKQRIKEQVTGAPVVLYMKGTPQAPQCGFSALAVQVLNACGVGEFQTFNVLADAEIRQGIKEYANWPTIPQLYVNGEFVGGSDIMREMYQSGELQKLLEGASQKAYGGVHLREIAAAEEVQVVEQVIQVVEMLPLLVARRHRPIG